MKDKKVNNSIIKYYSFQKKSWNELEENYKITYINLVRQLRIKKILDKI